MNDHNPTEPSTPHDLDRLLHAQLARLTQGISPASLVGAYMDWLAHLAMSPGKQQELLTKAVRKSLRLGLHATNAVHGHGKPCIEPLPQDRRFDAPEWQHWPFTLMYQSFLLHQQWWHNATTGVPGVTAHHEQVATFAIRQVLDMLSPSNYLATNPEVQAETLKSGGMNLLTGAQKQWQDMLRLATGEPMPGTEHFRPGQEVALTPGKVVFRNHLIELIQYGAQTDTVCAEPVLIVPSWIMKYYILDLSPGNSLVSYLVGQGHTVFIMSWKNPGSGNSHLGMDDYLKAGVMAAIDAVTAIVPEHPIQALGYCLGGTLPSIAAAFMARSHDRRLKSLTLPAAELDFTEPGELGLFIDECDLYLKNDLAEGRYRVNGRPVVLSDIRVPIFSLGTLREAGAHYIAPDTWLATAPEHEGSRWPALGSEAHGYPALEDAPGRYVMVL